ncbi:MAG: transposase, partial [Magnetococcales bacterium]|nr:transposase [Magnetococcales bacterium]
MSQVRKRYTGEFKAKVALAAIRGDETAAQWASRFGVHPTMINGWRKQLEQAAAGVFDQGRKEGKEQETEQKIAELYRHIGQLKV